MYNSHTVLNNYIQHSVCTTTIIVVKNSSIQLIIPGIYFNVIFLKEMTKDLLTFEHVLRFPRP